MIAAADLAARHGLRRRTGGRDWAGDCPACGYANAFSLREKDGRALWWCASCGSDRDKLAEAVLGRAPQRTAAGAGHDRSEPPDGACKTALALEMWNAALPADRSPAQSYLAGRGLSLPDSGALRCLPDALHKPSGTRGLCMVALVTDAAGKPQAVHRTWLAPGGAGKAALDPPRMTLGPVGDGAVRLCRWTPGRPLVVGEGIETSLSAGLILGAPAWAALSAGNLARMPLPGGLTHLLIAADPDPTGQRHAWAAADAFTAAGLRVEVLTPDRGDFNDLLQRRTARDGNHG
ncbi:DUF7146 domain-containing protein [Sabulicella glaciei]|uniref:Toprim domain-containing protein n=1 Tax=Sabulicella glaciei TaxID=2984948 RepID=A0ABT3NWW5_9PROT|nr:toprim domain-containing protein [Roseococcus sp. MDT2-1-1]MCW8086611.1 toprim domain-containing protein [Roseococcus sp. MDT2-1-1]